MRQVNPKTMVALALLGILACGKTATTKPHDASTNAPEAQPETLPPADLPGPRDGTTASDSIVGADVPAVDAPPEVDGAPRIDQAVDASTVPIDVPGIDAPAGIDTPAVDAPDPADAPAAYEVWTGDPIRPPLEVSYSGDVANLAELCTQTGGGVVMAHIGTNIGVRDFNEGCYNPAGWPCSHACVDVARCLCPGNGCFILPYGCVTPADCTVGADPTCNDNPALSVIHGHCIEGGYCQCTGGANPLTGKCL